MFDSMPKNQVNSFLVNQVPEVVLGVSIIKVKYASRFEQDVELRLHLKRSGYEIEDFRGDGFAIYGAVNPKDLADWLRSFYASQC